MVFEVPDESPPSTPNSHFFRDDPSTTPAGPPPTNFTSNSFTPAGNPPPSIFGSSEIGSAFPSSRPSFQPSGRGPSFTSQQPQSSLFQPRQKPSSARATASFSAPQSSPPYPTRRRYQGNLESEEEDEYDDDDAIDDDVDDEMSEDMDAEGDEDDMDYEDEDEDEEDEEEHVRPLKAPPFSLSGSGFLNNIGKSQSFGQSTHSTAFQASEMRQKPTQTRYDFLGLAKGLAASSKQVVVDDPDDLILETERLMTTLEEASTLDDPRATLRVLKEVAQNLQELWQATSKSPPQIGKKRISNLQNAIALASLLLSLHQPTQPSDKQDMAASSLSRSSFSTRSATGPAKETPIPKVLIDWLNTYHELTPSDVDVVLEQGRDYSSHPQFWDAVLGSCFRGRFTDTITLLRDANFRVAQTAMDDGRDAPGYLGVQLTNIEKVVDDVLEVLEANPIVRSENWDIKGPEWTLYRRKVYQSMNQLREFAEGQSYDRGNSEEDLHAKGLANISANKTGSLSIASRKAQSRVPWTIYESLVNLYDHLLGNQSEIINNALDWIEAVVGATIWWDGEDDEAPTENLRASRFSLSRSQRSRAVDVSPVASYLRRLSISLALVSESEDEELEINTASPLEVGLACIFEDNIEGIVAILRSLSLPVASAIVEMASAAKWLTGTSNTLLRNFDKSDLMVLSYGQEDARRDPISKDKLLVQYAKILSRKPSYTSADGSISKEGWELAMQIISRVDDATIVEQNIVPLLDSIELTSADVVDKVLSACTQLGFIEYGRALAEGYADELATEPTEASETYAYGAALLYYARSRKSKKIVDVLNLLMSYCLITSAAYPPANKLDAKLKSLLNNPREELNALAKVDLDAAKMLVGNLSGYATLRKFYELRDEAISAKRQGTTPKHKPIHRKRLAAQALITMITSASSSISGGLYDPSAEGVVQVDGLLVLLGECLPLLKSKPRVLSVDQLNVLMGAIEDMATAPSLIKEQCNACLSSALAAYQGSEPESPRDLLKKSISALSQDSEGSKAASSQFSLVGSSMMLSGKASGANSQVLGDGETKGWDWRAGFDGDVSGEDLLKVLRLAVVEDVARAWAE